MNFTENQQGFVIIDKLFSQQQAGQFCDIEFFIEDRKYKAHRNVLAANSSYFSSIFKSKKVTKERVTIKRCKNVDAFQSFFNYMYTGVIQIDWNNVSDLLAIANQFIVQKVIEYCKIFLQKNLTSNNCLFVSEMANKYTLSDLKNESLNVIQCHIVEILEHKSTLQLSELKLRKLLLDEFNFPQQELFNFLCQWVEFDVENRQNSFLNLLKFVNFQMLDLASLLEHIKLSPFFQKNHQCLTYLITFLRKENFFEGEDKINFENLKNAFSNEHNIDDFLKNISTFEDGPHFISRSIKNSKENESNSLVARNQQNLKSKYPQKPTYIPMTTNRISKIQNIKMLHRDSLDNELVTSSTSETNTSPTLNPQAIDKYHAKKHKQENVKCDNCSFTTQCKEKLAFHIARAHKIDATLKCSECDFKCKWMREYTAHLKTHYKGPPFRCKKCEFTSKKIYSLSSHLFRHCDDRPFLCGQCDQRFKSPLLLKKHMSTQHASEKPFICDKCERRFPAKYLLTEHEFFHRKDNPFLCDTCGFSTKDKRYLIVHKRTHTGNVHHCDHPGCNYGTVYKHSLTIHKRRHTGERPYVCSYCGRNFADRSYLIEHERIHLNVNRYQCEQCDFTNSRRRMLREHIKRYHSVEASPKGSFRPRKKRIVRVQGDDDDDDRNTLNLDLPITNQNDKKAGDKINLISNESQVFSNFSLAPPCLNNMQVIEQQIRSIDQYEGNSNQSTILSFSALNSDLPQEAHTNLRSYMNLL